jgi:hypothetical protein
MQTKKFQDDPKKSFLLEGRKNSFSFNGQNRICKKIDFFTKFFGYFSKTVLLELAKYFFFKYSK